MDWLCWALMHNYDDGTTIIAGNINLSDYLPDSNGLKSSGRTNLVFRIGLNFEQFFRTPPAMSVTGNLRNVGAKRPNQRGVVPVISQVTTEHCNIVVDLQATHRALDGLFLSWTAIGATALSRSGST